MTAEVYSKPSQKSKMEHFAKKAKNSRGVVVIATAQLHSTKPELRFRADSNPARGISEIRDCEDL